MAKGSPLYLVVGLISKIRLLSGSRVSRCLRILLQWCLCSGGFLHVRGVGYLGEGLF